MKTARHSASSRMNFSVSRARRVLMATGIAPARMAPKKISRNSTRFPTIMPTRSPGFTQVPHEARGAVGTLVEPRVGDLALRAAVEVDDGDLVGKAPDGIREEVTEVRVAAH